MVHELAVGDRIEGVGSHRGKSGEVMATWNYPRVLVRWDGGRKNSTVDTRMLIKVET
jgi:hypothetical protein